MMGKMRKNMLTVPMILLAMAVGIPGGVMAAPDAYGREPAVQSTYIEHRYGDIPCMAEVSDEKDLRDAMEQAPAGEQVRILLTETILIHKPLEVAGRDVVLQGVSDEVELKASYSPAARTENLKSLLTVGEDASLVLADVKVNADQRGRVCHVKSGGTLTLGEGAVLMNGENTRTVGRAFGIGLYVSNGGHAFMEEGSMICGNCSSSDAEGIGVCNAGTFYMSGGSICDNVSEEGAVSLGIGVNNAGSFAMTGGDISQNTGRLNTDQELPCEYVTKGGAVYQGCGELLISGNAVLAKNEADLGGGIYGQGGNVSVTGSGVTISGNRACAGGAIYMCGIQSNLYGSLWLNGASIIENEAVLSDMPVSGNGAGIYVGGGRVTMVSGSIRDNHVVSEPAGKADEYSDVKGLGAGIYLAGCDNSDERAARSVLHLNGGIISGNDASQGGGIYAANYCVDEEGVHYGNADFYVKGAPKVLDNGGGNIVLAPAKAVLDTEPAFGVFPQTVRTTGDLQVLDKDGKLSASAVLPVYKESCTYVDIDGRTKTDDVLIVSVDGQEAAGR